MVIIGPLIAPEEGLVKKLENVTMKINQIQMNTGVLYITEKWVLLRFSLHFRFGFCNNENRFYLFIQMSATKLAISSFIEFGFLQLFALAREWSRWGHFDTVAKCIVARNIKYTGQMYLYYVGFTHRLPTECKQWQWSWPAASEWWCWRRWWWRHMRRLDQLQTLVHAANIHLIQFQFSNRWRTRNDRNLVHTERWNNHWRHIRINETLPKSTSRWKW